VESTGHLIKYPFYMLVRCVFRVAMGIRAGGIDEGGRWRYEFLPSENPHNQ
jgi:hypothetical protein